MSDATAADPAALLDDEPHEVAVPELGGSVYVRGLTMPELLRYSAMSKRLALPQDGETDEEARERAQGDMVGWALHFGVRQKDGKAFGGVDKWNAFGGRNLGVALDLFARVMARTGANREHEKKT